MSGGSRRHTFPGRAIGTAVGCGHAAAAELAPENVAVRQGGLQRGVMSDNRRLEESNALSYNAGTG